MPRMGVLLLALLLGQEGRVAVPSAEAQKTAEKEIRDLFKTEYAVRERDARRLFAGKLLQQAAGTTEAPLRYVLLRESRDLSLEIFDPPGAFAAIEEMAKVFDVKSIDLKSAAVGTLKKGVKSPEQGEVLAEAALRLAREAAAAADFDAALKSARDAETAAKAAKNPVLVDAAAEFSKEIPDLKREQAEFSKAELGIAANPNDPAANLALGKYLCFVQGEWDKGSACLMKGSDEALKAAATQEFLHPAAPEAQVEAADRWFALASDKSRSALDKRRFRSRALFWYEAALSGATGILKTRVEKKIEECRKSGGRDRGEIDLLALVDPKADAVIGDWTLAGKILVQATVTPLARVQLPYFPPEEYQLEVTVENRGGEGMAITMVHGDTQSTLALDGFGTALISGIGLIDGKWTGDNETTRRGRLLELNKPTPIVITVRKGSIVVTVNGKPTFDWKGDFKRLSVHANYASKTPKTLVLGGFSGSFAFSRAVLIPLSGAGRRLR